MLEKMQNVICEYICKHFGPRSALTKCRLLITFVNSLDPELVPQTSKTAGSGAKLFDTDSIPERI